MSIELYPHNQETYNKIKELWKTSNKVATCQPTGTGKSFLILKCAEDFNDKNIIILTPQIHIIEQFQANDSGINGINYITYAKLQFMSEKEIKELSPQLIVLDEFHRCGAEEWGNGVQRLLEVYPESKVLGTSATPIRYLDNSRDMSDELFNGNVACNMTLPEAIIKEILPMPKYISALYTFDEETDNMIEKINKSKNSEEEKIELISDVNKLRNKLDKSKGIPKILSKHIVVENGRYLVFCKNKEHMEEMKPFVIDWFNKHFKEKKLNYSVTTYEVYSDLEESDEQLQLFMKDDTEDTVKLLFCINMLNEGLHISNLDGVILLRPTTSPIMYYQQIGRAIDAGKKESSLILDLVNNFSSIRTNTLKKDLEDTAVSFCADRGMNKKEQKEFVDKFKVIDETCDVLSLFEDIEDRLQDSWDLNIKALDQFYKREGHSKMDGNYVEIVDGKNVQLGLFCKTVRGSYHNKNYKTFYLNEKRISELQKFDFEFNVKQYYDWYDSFKLLQDYYLINKNSLVPNNYIINGCKLGVWVSSQRTNYKDNILTKNQIEKLNTVKFIFNTVDYKWELMYECLCKYVNENGTSDVPQHCKFKGYGLGQWVSSQRTLFCQNKLKEDRIQKLNNVNFVFNEQDKNKMRIMELKKYFKENGKFSTIPPNYISNNIRLGSYVSRLRKQYRNNKLSEDEVKFFINIGIKFTHTISIICLDTKEIFDSIKDASYKYNVSIAAICSSIKRVNGTSGTLPDGTRLHWMYYEDYLKLHNETIE